MKVTKERIKEIIAAVLGIDSALVDDDANPATLEKWDSINHMKIVVALEDEFDIELEEWEISEMLSLPLIEVVLKDKIPDFT